jgi:hypothetical protein
VLKQKVNGKEGDGMMKEGDNKQNKSNKLLVLSIIGVIYMTKTNITIVITSHKLVIS